MVRRWFVQRYATPHRPAILVNRLPWPNSQMRPKKHEARWRADRYHAREQTPRSPRRNPRYDPWYPAFRATMFFIGLRPLSKMSCALPLRWAKSQRRRRSSMSSDRNSRSTTRRGLMRLQRGAQRATREGHCFQHVQAVTGGDRSVRKEGARQPPTNFSTSIQCGLRRHSNG